jgi:hypothetical protein
MGSLWAPAGKDIWLVETQIVNTTATAVMVALRRFTAQGTPGSAITANKEDVDYTVLSVVNDVHSATPTFVTGNVEYLPLPAAAGGGVNPTYGGRGLRIKLGTANGIGWVLGEGTGQICTVKFVWDE